jgi:peptidoglycan/xylan/chitin deacetylase (PgdA/CDA1 family)
MTSAQWALARSLEQRGHVVACHGYAHVEYNTISADAMRSDLMSAQKTMRRNGCTRGARILVAPYGQFGNTADHFSVLQDYTDCALGVTSVPMWESTDPTDVMSRGKLWNANPIIDRRFMSRGLLGDTDFTTANLDILIASKGMEVVMQHAVGGSYLSQAQYETAFAYVAAAEVAGTMEVSTIEKEVYG